MNPLQLYEKLCLVFGENSEECQLFIELFKKSELANPWVKLPDLEEDITGKETLLPQVGVPVRCVVIDQSTKVMDAENNLQNKKRVKTLYFNGLVFADRDGNLYGRGTVTHYKQLDKFPE